MSVKLCAAGERHQQRRVRQRDHEEAATASCRRASPRVLGRAGGGRSRRRIVLGEDVGGEREHAADRATASSVRVVGPAGNVRSAERPSGTPPARAARAAADRGTSAGRDRARRRAARRSSTRPGRRGLRSAPPARAGRARSGLGVADRMPGAAARALCQRGAAHSVSSISLRPGSSSIRSAWWRP